MCCMVMFQLPVLCGGVILSESHLPADPLCTSSITTCANQEKEIERYAYWKLQIIPKLYYFHNQLTLLHWPESFLKSKQSRTKSINFLSFIEPKGSLLFSSWSRWLLSTFSCPVPLILSLPSHYLTFMLRMPQDIFWIYSIVEKRIVSLNVQDISSIAVS